MATSTGTDPGAWRAGWARRENARRRREHEHASSVWERADAELRSLAATARSPRPVAADQVPWLDLRPGEQVWWHSPSARLVRAAGIVPTLRRPRFHDFTPSQLAGPFADRVPADLRLMDTGPVAITDRRVVFGGARRRDWVLVRLALLAHDPDRTVTWLSAAGTHEGPAIGLVLDSYAVAGFRFHLTRALAEISGRRSEFAAHLERLRAAHRRERPLPPATVRPADAPNPLVPPLAALARLYAGPSGASSARRVTRCVAAVAVTLALASVALPAFPAFPRPSTTVPGELTVAGLGGPEVDTESLVPPGADSADSADSGADSQRLGPDPARHSGPSPRASRSRPADTATPRPSVPANRAPSPAAGKGHGRGRELARTRDPAAAAGGSDSARSPGSADSSGSSGPAGSPDSPGPQGQSGDADRCGAPANPYGYHFCGNGRPIASPEPGICGYFRCTTDFWAGTGFLVQCRDDAISMDGGHRGACAGHRGVLRMVRGTPGR
ncbi:hypothetical protein SAMN05421678_103295 [Actinopolymorpha cephalotaxi]|uniref:Uncharacterized protein n=1 Tax=Actinopolymorpha cephalotaxi TaxID=504797 RepID=A0A1I2NID7_9ACTN|nr:hypothetical protein [Actinopolymorpha cephalotaxi]NYH85597.1 hypothetical protein [Actinopolymorpha cephalotaxi]SFG01206.1 hypothetical protein SAMN05421678_103295 [Actinopolymorpha cephalotaxi]